MVHESLHFSSSRGTLMLLVSGACFENRGCRLSFLSPCVEAVGWGEGFLCLLYAAKDDYFQFLLKREVKHILIP